jgi:myo-inositol-1(or 4)-monophosphatase
MHQPSVSKDSPSPGAERGRRFYADALRQTLREAGALALSTFRGELRHWTKGESSPVCEADIAVNDLLRERLGGMEGIAWLSEESKDDAARLSAPLVWIVDPIDGTRAYIEGRSDWSISVALVADGRPVVAALYAPVSDEFFLGVAGEGATLNGAPLAVSSGESLTGARVAGPKDTLKRFIEATPEIVLVPKVFSLALRLARVAQGEFDVAYASGNSHDWDLAAADLLVHEAGGAMTTVTGERLLYNRADPVHKPLVAAGMSRHRKVVDLMRGRPHAAG